MEKLFQLLFVATLYAWNTTVFWSTLLKIDLLDVWE